MAQQELEIQGVWALFRETAQMIKESDKKFDKMSEQTNQKIEKMSAKVEKTSAEVEKMSAEVEKMSIKIREVGGHVDGLAGSWGKFVEGIVAPGGVRMFRGKNIDVKWTSTRNRVRKDGEEMEVDIILENDEYAVVIEVKSTLNVEVVNWFLDRLEKFKEFFPRFKEHKVLGAVAGIVIEERSDRYAYRKGLFVIAQTGETVQILNDDKFKPKEW